MPGLQVDVNRSGPATLRHNYSCSAVRAGRAGEEIDARPAPEASPPTPGARAKPSPAPWSERHADATASTRTARSITFITGAPREIPTVGQGAVPQRTVVQTNFAPDSVSRSKTRIITQDRPPALPLSLPDRHPCGTVIFPMSWTGSTARAFPRF